MAPGMGPAALFQMSVLHEGMLANQIASSNYRLRHHRVTGLEDIGAGAPWSAGSNTFNLPWSQGSHQACSLSLLDVWACTMRWRPRILLLGIPAWPPESGGCNARCALLQSIACAYHLRGIAASQDLHDGGLSCHVPPAAGPTA